MADNQVFNVVNRNHRLRVILDELDFNLDICILKHNLDAISARRRDRRIENVHTAAQIWIPMSAVTVRTILTMMQIKKAAMPGSTAANPPKRRHINDY